MCDCNLLLAQVKPFIWVEAQIERHSRSRVEMLIKARSQFKEEKAEFHLPSITAEEATPERKAPTRVKFEIPCFTVSGIQHSGKLAPSMAFYFD
ncbi:hypothetical protein HID58_085848, partial [Brassica napus]